MKASVLLVLPCILRAALLRQKSSTVLSAFEKTQSDATAVVSALLKELQSEQKGDEQFSAVFQQWCQNSESQKQGMAQSMQRKVDDSKSMMRQIESETKRLENELSLIQANKQEKMRQLMEANDTESFVAHEYSMELSDMDKTIEAAQHAVHLAVQSADNRKGQETDTTEAADEVLTDLDKSVKGLDGDNEKPTGSNHQQDLSNALNDILGRLQSDRSSVLDGRESTDRKATTFVEHLNSSIFETNSQVASIQMEIAQRHREQVRLEGQVSDLSRFLNTVKDSTKRTQATCSMYLQEQAHVVHFVHGEIDLAKTILEQTEPENADMFLSPSFLQVDEDTQGGPSLSVQEVMTNMAQKYPNEAPLYKSFANSFRHMPAHRMSLSEHGVEPPVKSSSTDDAAGSADNPALQDIQRFVAAADSEDKDEGDIVTISGDTRPLLSDPSEAQKIKISYMSLVAHLQAKQQSAQDSQKWCQYALREAKVDDTKTKRTVNRMRARLNLVKDSMFNYKKDAMYYTDEGKSLQNQGRKLVELSKQADRQHSRSQEALGDLSKQLMSVAAEMSELLTAEERRAAGMTKSLIEKVENHENMLEVKRQMWEKSKSALLEADADIQTVMTMNIHHNDRRTIESQIQSQFFTSRLHIHQHDTDLSANFKDLAQDMCSNEAVAAMKNEVGSLQRQVAELKRSFSENVAPFA